LDLYSEITERDNDDYIDLRQLKERSEDPSFDPVGELRTQCEQLQRHGCSVGAELAQAVNLLGDDTDTDNTMLTMIVDIASDAIDADNDRLEPMRKQFARYSPDPQHVFHLICLVRTPVRYYCRALLL
jgi:hypothetical protein